MSAHEDEVLRVQMKRMVSLRAQAWAHGEV